MFVWVCEKYCGPHSGKLMTGQMFVVIFTVPSCRQHEITALCQLPSLLPEPTTPLSPPWSLQQKVLTYAYDTGYSPQFLF